MSQSEDSPLYHMPAQMTSGAELLEVHNGPPWPGLTLVYSVPHKPAGPSLSERERLLAEFDARAAQTRADNAESFKAWDAARKQVKAPSKRTLAERRAAREGRAQTPAWLLDESDPLLDAAMQDPEGTSRDDQA
jgi:hypothetical protein